ncbi:MAG: response regulator transcription factor [Azospirillum sp.]|nr:response regulator transcription factor [Azospirillum sp.]
MANFVLIARHSVYRRGIADILTEIDPSARVVDCADVKQAKAALQGLGAAELVLIDPLIDDTMDFFALREAFPRAQAPRLVALSETARRASILAALAAGFFGYIVQSQSEAEAKAALRDVLAGRIYVPPSLATVGSADTAHYHGGDSRTYTARQADVLRHLAEGQSNKAIARVLNIAESTVKVHVAALMRILGVHSRAQIALAARRELDQHAAMRPSNPDNAAST